MSEIDISQMDKAAVLAALYNRARPLGMGMLQFKPGDMSVEQARTIMTDGDSSDYPSANEPQTTYFDYLHGRVMKINLAGDVLRTGCYDRDNGEGAAEQALRDAGLLNSEAA